MTNQEKVLSRFLRQEQGAKSISKYVLRHAGKGGKGHDVESFEIVEALGPEEIDLLANTIHGRAQMDADGFGPGLQRYTLTAFLVDGKATGRIVFRVRGDADIELDEETESGEEAPTNRGLMQQLMRHNEANNRTMVGSMGGMMQMMVRRMESQDRAMEKLQEERTRTFEIIEEAKSGHMEREIMAYREKAKEARIDFGIRKLAVLAPVALDHLTGGKMQAKDSSFAIMLKELVGNMAPEQFEAIAKALGPEQQIVFFRLLQTLKAQEGEQKRLEGGTNGTEVS